jgi:hypothetical protein
MIDPLERPTPEPCPRCQGKMLPAPDDGDSVCFTCGHMAYAEAPADLHLDRPTTYFPCGKKAGLTSTDVS